MIKITLRQFFTVALCIYGMQLFAQFTPGTYRLKNVLSGDYMEVVDLKANDANSVYVKPYKDTDNSQVFTFIATGGEYNGKTRYNIESATGLGVLRAESTNVYVDNTQAPSTSNPRNFVVHELGVNADTGLPMFGFQAATSSGRWPAQGIDDNSDNCTYLGGASADRARWYLESATILSTNKIDNSSVFISNPVLNEMTISGNIDFQQVNVYNVSGELVLSSKVKGESVRLDVKTLTKGIYFVQLQGASGSLSKKIIKN